MIWLRPRPSSSKACIALNNGLRVRTGRSATRHDGLLQNKLALHCVSAEVLVHDVCAGGLEGEREGGEVSVRRSGPRARGRGLTWRAIKSDTLQGGMRATSQTRLNRVDHEARYLLVDYSVDHDPALLLNLIPLHHRHLTSLQPHLVHLAQHHSRADCCPDRPPSQPRGWCRSGRGDHPVGARGRAGPGRERVQLGAHGW